jgi:hypothetical protein
MADKKISQLTAATTPLAGTEVLPIVQSGSTVKVASDDLTVKNVRSNATTGILQVTGPGAGSTRVMTTPNANFTAARTDAGQTFTGDQAMTGNLAVDTDTLYVNSSTDKVGIGTTNPGYKLTIAGSAGTATASLLESGVRSWGIRAGGDATNTFDIADFTAGASRLLIDSSGNVKVRSNNLIFETAAKGIDFSANTGAAGETSALLNWYEEGTFTPTLQGSTGNPTPTYTAQVGTYTRIGNVVYVWIQVYTSAVSGGTGDLRIGDLPFSTNASYGARFIVTCTRVDFSATTTYVNAAVDGSSNKIYLAETNDNSNDTVVPISAWNAGAAAGVSISGFYFV